jgi:hypothetical protein
LINDEGFVTQKSLSFFECETLNRNAKFINENYHLFTPEQINFFYTEFLTHLKVSLNGNIMYAGAKLEDIKEFYTEPIKLISKGLNTKTNVFGEFYINAKGIDEKKNPNYNPFVTKMVS